MQTRTRPTRSRRGEFHRGRVSLHRWLRIAVAVVALFHPTLAGVIVVDGESCTLVDAITAANTDTATGGCPSGSGGDTIKLTADVTLTEVHNVSAEDGYPNGLPPLASEITIESGGFAIERDPDAPPFRLLEVLETGSLTLDEVALRNGSGTARYGYPVSGGALTNRGATILTNSTVSGNSGCALDNRAGVMSLEGCIVSDNTGVGIATYEEPSELTLTRTVVSGNAYAGLFGCCSVSVTDSVLTGNSRGVHGGGPLLLTLENTTVSGNTGAGIGVYMYSGSFLVANTTVSGNGGNGIDFGNYAGSAVIVNTTVSGNGGEGLDFRLQYGKVEIRHATVTMNSGLGLLVESLEEDSELFHSVVADNEGGNCLTFDVIGSLNLDDDGTCPDSAPITGLDPVLADNGGPTATHALLPGSSAIDRVDACEEPTMDQRGLPRDASCDAGAFEFQCDITVDEDGTDTVIMFTPASGDFDLVAGDLADLRADRDFSDASCLGTFSATPAVDPLPDPPSGEGRYYLARGLTDCPGAGYGASTLDPDPRDALDAGPCP